MCSVLCIIKFNNMNTLLWILQGLIAGVFLYSGITKTILSEQTLVTSLGQTGVKGLPMGLTRFIGISEILGAFGMILPMLLKIDPVLTPIAAICFAIIMVPAGIIHYRLHEKRNVLDNFILFLICLFIALGRMLH